MVCGDNSLVVFVMSQCCDIANHRHLGHVTTIKLYIFSLWLTHFFEAIPIHQDCGSSGIQYLPSGHCLLSALCLIALGGGNWKAPKRGTNKGQISNLRGSGVFFWQFHWLFVFSSSSWLSSSIHHISLSLVLYSYFRCFINCAIFTFIWHWKSHYGFRNYEVH